MAPQPSRNRRRWQIIHADCLQALPKQDAASIDAVVTDPPYGISMVGMKWDRPRSLDPARPPGRRRSRANPSVAFRAFCAEWAHECSRVLKPGGHLAAFAAPRTAHLLACGIEDASFELRDTLMWIQGNGFPGSRPLSNGRGTRLKPAYEPIILARKPVEGTLDQTLARYGTGALNIDACRVDLSPKTAPMKAERTPVTSRRASVVAGPRTCCSPTAGNAPANAASATARSRCSASATASSTPPKRRAASARPAASSYHDAPSRHLG